MGLLFGLAWPAQIRCEERLTDWIEGIELAARATSRGDFLPAEQGARAALAALPNGQAGARARLALAIALRGQARFAEAADALADGFGALGRGLAAIVPWLRADALLYSGHPGAAAQLFAEVSASESGSLAAEARWREADALLAAGLAAPAARAFGALLATQGAHAAALGARLSLAEAHRALGEGARAAAELRRLWLEVPDRPEGCAAGRALLASRGGGAPSPEPTVAERLERAERLLSRARARAALGELNRADRLAPGPPPARSALLRSLSLLQIGRFGEAEAIARELRARPEAERADAPGVELVLARAAARAGRTDEAGALYVEVARSRPRIPGMAAQQQRDLPDDALYLAAWLPYDAGRYGEAIRRLGRFLREHPDSHRAEDARWFRAWSWFRMGRHREADRALARLQQGPLAPAALYWRARLASSRQRQASLYRAALRASEGGWYGLIAAARLASLGIAASPFPHAAPPRPLPAAPSGPEVPALARAEALLALGLRGWALSELDALARGRAARDLAPLLAELAESAGDPEIPFRMARDHLLPTRRALRWSHPLAYAETLVPAAEALGLDPFLLLAVMRRESSFRREARSGAAAEGLLQLIPPTSERLATILGLPLDLASRLAEPEVSIAFGALYLSLLAARFPGPAPLVAAYNAGPRAVAAWATERAGVPLDEWVEDIPFRETRNYVRTVVADAFLYRELRGRRGAGIDPSSPVPVPPPGIAF